MKMLKPKIILVADRTLSGSYKILFEAIFATMQTTHVPEVMMRQFVSPKVSVDPQGRAARAPLGLCRLEAALREHTGMSAEQIVCTTPEALPKLLGEQTEIVAFSSSDPLGMGMSNTTTKNFWKGQLYTQYWSNRTLSLLKGAKEKYNFKVVAGGAGAWQFRQYPDQTAKQAVDVIFEGYFENTGPGIFSDMLEGKDFPDHYVEKASCAENIKPVITPTVLGIVEISRGCGRGCKFCTMGHQKMQHLSPGLIKQDIKTNICCGQKNIVLASEDLFRYGSENLNPDTGKLIEMLETLQTIDGLDFLQLDHANVSTAAQIPLDELRQIRRLLAFKNDPKYLWLNMGLESANGELVKRSCPTKIHPFQPEQWEGLICDTAEKMKSAGFFPVYSLILGLPGETLEDVERTSKLIDRLDAIESVIFPVFFEPIDPQQIAGGERFSIDKMTLEHLNLYRKCYEINFKRMPKLFWDNQTAGGEAFIKKMFVQMLGKVEILTWRKSFASLHKKIVRSAKAKAKEGHLVA